MHLSKVEIRNFRSFENLEFDLRPGLNVLVGRNNTGKTNLLHAIRHAIGPSATRGDSIWLEREDFYKTSSSDTAERTISITLIFSNLSDEQRAFFYDIVDFDHSNLANSNAIIRFDAFWPKNKRQATIKRTGGNLSAEAVEVPTRILECIPITFLPAMRDAEAFLAPGYRNRLASLLKDLVKRHGTNFEEEIKSIFKDANEKLEAHPLIDTTMNSLKATAKELAGSDYSSSSIKAAGVEFEKILRSLQVQMDDSPVGSLDANGLGYNNLLYMAVILEHLKSPEVDECPIFLVEEPEAHLHPQLVVLLADYLANKTPGIKTPQTLVTTHSSVLVSSLPPDRIHILHSETHTAKICCNSIGNLGMDERELSELHRMMDITKAALYFSKAAILVEGISESLLLPILAKRIGHDLEKRHISVIPICGVAFETFKNLLGPKGLGIPIAIVTDADPPVLRGKSWKEDKPIYEGTEPKVSDRTKKLLRVFEGSQSVRIFYSRITLEYDLALAGEKNCLLMARVWEKCFSGLPGTFNSAKVFEAGTSLEERAIAAWRGICRADHTGSKAFFSQRLADRLTEKYSNGPPISFDVPAYLKEAIEYVTNALTSLATAQNPGPIL